MGRLLLHLRSRRLNGALSLITLFPRGIPRRNCRNHGSRTRRAWTPTGVIDSLDHYHVWSAHNYYDDPHCWPGNYRSPFWPKFHYRHSPYHHHNHTDAEFTAPYRTATHTLSAFHSPEAAQFVDSDTKTLTSTKRFKSAANPGTCRSARTKSSPSTGHGQ